ncbi:MAG: hypothetical protein J3K34DRAFT_522297 [Monoraphidium minutum]|nr:MAG: hypothetical protein J3K34DRAFT_522297 [Monoraphidium minutum]
MAAPGPAALRFALRDPSSVWRMCASCQRRATTLGRRGSRRPSSAAAASAAPPRAAAADGTPPPPPRVRAEGPGGWAVRAASPGDPLVAVIDGTNVAMRCRGPRSGAATAAAGAGGGEAARFRAWLRFLRAATGAAAALVAFDNKGSTGGNARAALDPRYNQRRYARGGGGAAAAAQGAVLPGWSHLDGAARAEGCVPVHAAVGYEADDVMATMAEWLRGQPAPPAVVLVSSDSDMQQLMCPHTFWLELEEAPSKARPSALRLHSAAEFAAGHGYAPSRHAAFLSLAGKKAAGVAGLGVGERPARRLVQRYPDLGAILAAADAGELAAFCGAPVQALLRGADARAAAARNLRVLTLVADAQRVPPEAEAAQAQQAQQQQQPPQPQPALPDLVALHPSVAARWSAAAPHLAAAAAALAALRLPHVARWVSPEGLPLDLVVRAYDPASGRLLPALAAPGGGAAAGRYEEAVGGGGAEGGGGFEPGDCVALQLLGLEDAPAPTLGAAGAPGAWPRALPAAAKRRRALLKACGWRVAAVAAADLDALSGGGGGGGGGAQQRVADHLRAVLLEAVGAAGVTRG